MPRYIDADALVIKLPDDLPYKASVKRVLLQAPTLDVVPREEFEALQRRYDLAVAEREANAKALVDANIDLDAMRGAANSLKMHYENVKQETARDIFAEIDILGTYNPMLYAELKKKYTEDSTDGKRTDR